MQFVGSRQEPNIINWFRWEHFGKGLSSKLFYNEVPQPTTFRHGGHLEHPEKTLYSFTHANQDKHFIFGMDTTKPEGRAAFEEEWKNLAQIAPELIDKDKIVYPHEHSPYVSNEPHFRRMWQHYRELHLKNRFVQLLENGVIS